MQIIPEKILTVTDKASFELISGALDRLTGVEALAADTENQAFELIFNHFFILVIVDETLTRIDPYKIGAMLMSRRHLHNAPLLIITDKITPDPFLEDFSALQIDYLIKPFTESLIRSKIKIFYELFRQKNAVTQSIEELDKAYQKIMDQHELVLREEFSRKELVSRSGIAAGQMQQPLRSLQGNVYRLLREPGLSDRSRTGLSAVKTAADQISMITKKMQALPGKSKKILAMGPEQAGVGHSFRILYVQYSREEFNIFNHFIKSVVKCELTHAATIAQSLDLIGEHRFDLIFIDMALPDGSGLTLLSRLKQMRSDIPVVFALDKAHLYQGPEAVSKGAFTYFAKEEVSSGNILSMIYGTFKKAGIIQEIEDARNRIVTIARKDTLTRLYNRRCFEEALESETAKARRYNLPLSILIIDFDDFKSLNHAHGYDTGDTILSNSAALLFSMVRGNDVVCRYGGEEFGVVLPNTAVNGARILARRIRKKMADHEFEKDESIVKLTVSIGIAAFDPATDDSGAGFVKKALDALSSAVSSGGNMVKTFITES